MLELEVKSDLIQHWQSQGGLYKRFITLIETLAVDTISKDIDVQKRNIAEIFAIRRLASVNSPAKPSAALIVPYYVT